MKVKITSTILSYKGEPMLEKIDGKDEEMTWRAAVFTALNNFSQDEKPNAELKSTCFQISLKIHASDEVELTAKERSIVMERIEKIFTSPLICGRAKEFFEDKKK